MNNEIYLDERVTVLASFGYGLAVCLPRIIRRKRGQEIRVSEVGISYPVKKGNKVLRIFEVTDGLADYRLEFDAVSLVWRLTREADREG